MSLRRACPARARGPCERDRRRPPATPGSTPENASSVGYDAARSARAVRSLPRIQADQSLLPARRTGRAPAGSPGTHSERAVGEEQATLSVRAGSDHARKPCARYSFRPKQKRARGQPDGTRVPDSSRSRRATNRWAECSSSRRAEVSRGSPTICGQAGLGVSQAPDTSTVPSAVAPGCTYRLGVPTALSSPCTALAWATACRKARSTDIPEAREP